MKYRFDTAAFACAALLAATPVLAQTNPEPGAQPPMQTEPAQAQPAPPSTEQTPQGQTSTTPKKKSSHKKHHGTHKKQPQAGTTQGQGSSGARGSTNQDTNQLNRQEMQEQGAPAGR
jgi:hypothetical protein